MPEVAPPASPPPELVEHPRVQAVLEIFGGSIAAVEAVDEDSGESE